MLEICGTKISLTRGDTARITVSAKNADGTVYALQEGDTLTFTMQRSVYDASDKLSKRIENGILIIEPSDTAGLEFGKYTYDIQLTLANGDVNTIIPPSDFTILEEVST